MLHLFYCFSTEASENSWKINVRYVLLVHKIRWKAVDSEEFNLFFSVAFSFGVYKSKNNDTSLALYKERSIFKEILSISKYQQILLVLHYDDAHFGMRNKIANKFVQSLETYLKHCTIL